MSEVVEYTPEALADADLANRYHFMRQQYTVEEVMAWHVQWLQHTFEKIATVWLAEIKEAIAARDSIGAAL